MLSIYLEIWRMTMSKKFVAGIYAVVGLCLLASSAFAVPMNDADWYLHVDVTSLKSGSLAEFVKERKNMHIDSDDKDVDVFLNSTLGKEFKNQIQQLTVYGDQAGYGDFTLIAQGPFTKEAKEAFFDRVKFSSDYTTSKFNGSTINKWTFEGYESKEKDSDGDHKISIQLGDDDKPVVLYSAEIDSKMIIVSKDEDEVKAWLKGSYSKKNLKGEGVFSVVVHLDRAIAHGALNLNDAGDMDFGFDSKMMKKITQFSFSLSEDDDIARIEVGLVATDEKVAMQLRNIANGLIALQSMAGDIDQDIQAVVSNLSIDVDGVNLLFKTSISTKQLKELVD